MQAQMTTTTMIKENLFQVQVKSLPPDLLLHHFSQEIQVLRHFFQEVQRNLLLREILMLFSVLLPRNTSVASDFLSDFPGSLPIVEEEFDITCNRSSYINSLCQKVLRLHYVTDYVKFQPRFRAVTYRPSASLPNGAKYPVIMMVHGNFELCGA